ncbi:MAG: prepilin-type N-terminal cleavage/methylation domain-containing protein [Candidatus Omnitrophica bacterium]|nr:prepilin-type N-terminal cleavage/methylation domain-containing protein [Candidatus Omnitrophota bacterium]
MKRLNKKGFTLVEIMIVVAIIGLLAAIAIPNFVQARTNAQTNACIANMKQLEGAVVLFNLDNGADPANVAALAPIYLTAAPSCPGGGVYTIGGGNRPTCSLGGAHVLP